MKEQGRYSTSGLVEDQYMPGSNGKVLRNLLGITTKKELIVSKPSCFSKSQISYLMNMTRVGGEHTETTSPDIRLALSRK